MSALFHMDAEVQVYETREAGQQLDVWWAEARNVEVQMKKLGQAREAVKALPEM